jgi:GTP 3',8-cyclase
MLKDKFERKINYLRLSLTDKCNLRCSYCMPADGVRRLPHDEVLRNEEFIYFIGIFTSLGVRKIRITGGEPLLRRGVMDIMSGVRAISPDLELCLTTNGILLNEYLDDLRSLKIKKLNISLDSLNRDRYAKITGRDELKRVLSNIEQALSSDYFDIKINAVLHKETLTELDNLIEFFQKKNVTLRFIERMPFVSGGQAQAFLPSDNLIEALQARGSLERYETMDTNVAAMYVLKTEKGAEMRVGIIPPMTHKFCGRCNRLRLTCDGMLRTCLHSSVEYNLKNPYRMDAGDDAVKKIILDAVMEKGREHNLEPVCDDNQGCTSISKVRSMSGIGG